MDNRNMWMAGMLSAAALVGAPSAALAADGDWSGIYAGVEAGAASGRLRASGSNPVIQLSNIIVPGRGLVVVPGTSVASSGSGTETNFIYGGIVGGQFQTGGLILGVEADLHGARDLSTNSNTVTIPATILAPPSSGTISRSAHMSYDWSARARIGAAIGADSMIYASGGIAGARVRLTGQDSFTTPAGAAPTSGNTPAFISPTIGPVVLTASQRHGIRGWTGGVGGETRLSRHIGIGLDARYTDYGSHAFALASGCGSSGSAVAGSCAGVTRTSPAIVINGTTLNPATDVTPAAVPSATSARFRDLRLTARVVLHF
jgi:outer membrane immunogenic protein